MIDEIKSGVMPDPRTEEAKELDYTHIAGSTIVNWREKPYTEWKRYTQRFQDGSSSCVFQAIAKAFETVLGYPVSASSYFWRMFYPNPGAYLQDGFHIALKRYFATEADEPSNNQTEQYMNTIRPLKTTLLGLSYYQPDFRDIDQIAQAIEQYGHCVLTFASLNEEWTLTPQYSGAKAKWGHAICAVDYSLIGNVKTLICEDSTGQGSSPTGLRLITKDFLEKRASGAGYFTGVEDIRTLTEKLKDIAMKIIQILQDKIKKLL